MAVNTAAVAARQRFGRELKRVRENTLRKGKRVQQIDLAKALGLKTYHRYSRIERGETWPKDDEWRTICRFLGVDAVTRATLSTMRSEGMSIASAWWTDFQEVMPESLIQFIAYEDAARSITTCAVNIPALLQTENYARSLTTGMAGSVLSPDAVGRSVEARRKRRGIFEKPEPTPVEFILAAGALHQEIGGPDVMVEQLDALLQDVQTCPVTIRVIPFDRPVTVMHMAHLLEFGGEGEKPVVVQDSQTGMTFRSSQREIKEAKSTIDTLRKLALSPLDSTDFIRSAKKEMSRARHD
ncbi:helix-turn-helix domain-containing protein [Streptomyces sp. JW3]|uniref:helix-turn-helix domain-containing protein n=1 Tax=Streptomyces sp. JW3 TaxID=3456955 RepID=UPI003FA49AF4